MTDLTFSTFLEFVAAVDRANSISKDLPAMERKLEDLRAEDKRLTEKLKASAVEVDAATRQAKELREKGEADRVQANKDATAAAEQIKTDARKGANAEVAKINDSIKALKADEAAEQAKLSALKAATTEAESRLAAVNKQIESLRKLVA